MLVNTCTGVNGIYFQGRESSYLLFFFHYEFFLENIMKCFKNATPRYVCVCVSVGVYKT